MDEDLEPTASDPQQIDVISGRSERERASSPDRILSAVGNEQRRAILDSLDSATNQTLEYDTLVDRVVDRIGDEQAGRGSDEQRKRIRIALHHNHLPILEAAQIIDYDTETSQVEFVGGGLEQDLLVLVKSHEADE